MRTGRGSELTQAAHLAARMMDRDVNVALRRIFAEIDGVLDAAGKAAELATQLDPKVADASERKASARAAAEADLERVLAREMSLGELGDQTGPPVVQQIQALHAAARELGL